MTTQRIDVDRQLDHIHHFDTIERRAPGQIKTVRGSNGRPLYWCHDADGEPWRWNNTTEQWEPLT